MSFRSVITTRRSMRSGRPAGFRPRLESLEDREVPATFTVLNLADNGSDSLRTAVAAANANPGADMIEFADGLIGTIGLSGGQLSITDHLTIDGPVTGVRYAMQRQNMRVEGNAHPARRGRRS